MAVKMIVQLLVPQKVIGNETETLQQVLEFYAVFHIIIQNPRWVLRQKQLHSSQKDLTLDFKLLEPIFTIWGFPKMVVPNNHGFSY